MIFKALGKTFGIPLARVQQNVISAAAYDRFLPPDSCPRTAQPSALKHRCHCNKSWAELQKLSQSRSRAIDLLLSYFRIGP
ncbi:hypothetical protein [Croceicoccus marinus]|uniref:hypothetical protein n=1 Tax=Croceicoccus marinus TaxID=450378 RepID=UPI0012F83884|nr:hypothetical protein [Croceicoccus marinus]